MALETVEITKKKMAERLEKLPSGPKPEYPPEKAKFMAIYEDLVKEKVNAYRKYLEDKTKFEAAPKAEEAAKSAEELKILEKEQKRGKKVKGELEKKIEEREKEIRRDFAICQRMMGEIENWRDDIEYWGKKIEKAEKRLAEQEFDDSRKNQRLRNRMENQIRDAEFEVKELKQKIAAMNEEHNVENKYKEMSGELDELRKQKMNLPDYEYLREEEAKKLEKSSFEYKQMILLKGYFDELELQGIAPEDIEKAGEQSAETLSKFYDVQGEIFRMTDRGKKFGLFGEMVAGSAQTAIGSLNALLTRNRSAAENRALGLYRLTSAARGLFFKKGPLAMGKMTMHIPSVEEAKERTKLFKLPEEDSPEKVSAALGDVLHEEPKIKEVKKISPEEAAEYYEITAEPEEMPGKEAEQEPEIELGEMEDEMDLAGEVVEKIFTGMRKSYEKYVESGSTDEKGVNKLFKAMKEAELKPSIFKKESRNTKRWLGRIQKWHKRIEKMDKDELKEELSRNIWDTIIQVRTTDLKKTGAVRSLTGYMFANFLLVRRLEQLEK